MIPTHPQWSARIAEYAKFVLDDDAIRRNWLERVDVDSSIFGPSELIEQIFVDLSADEGMDNLLESIGAHHPLYHSISNFIEALNCLNDALPDREGANEIADTLKSAEWQGVRRSAAKVLQVFG